MIQEISLSSSQQTTNKKEERMSSLAASRADNFYFPPEWRPEYGGISKFQGSKGANQYQKYGIIRFELPFDAWCLGCSRHMSKGLRFNAKKDKAGNYYSTTIFSFTMKCYSCDQQFVIKTNPQERTYDYAEGLRKHIQDYEPDKADGVIEILSDEQKQQIANDPMFKLQHTREDQRRTQNAIEQLKDLQSLQEETAKKDFEMNSLLRQQNRRLKKKELTQREEGRKKGLNVPLLDNSVTKEEEKAIKKLYAYHDLKKDSTDLLETSRERLSSQSIFHSGGQKDRTDQLKHTDRKRDKVRSYSEVVTEGSHRPPESIPAPKKRRIVDLSALQTNSSNNSTSTSLLLPTKLK